MNFIKNLILKHTPSQKLVINAGKDNELIIQDAPMVRFVQCDISGEKQTIPIIEFSNSQLKENK